MNSKYKENLIYRFLFLFISPLNGWKQIKNLRLTPEIVSKKLFYPLCALAALSVFFEILYKEDVLIENLLKQALIVFSSFFLGSFLILFLSSILLKKESNIKFQSNYGKVYNLINLSTLCLFYVIYNIIPILEPILVFTPIYTIYLIIKGSRLFKFEEKEKISSIIILIVLIIGTPICISYLLSSLLPIYN